MQDMETLYAIRDADGNIIGLDDHPQDPDDLPITPNDPALQEFLAESDISMVRVVEDLIDVLMDKNILRFTDLPESARKKLLQRKTARSAMRADGLLLTNEDIL